MGHKREEIKVERCGELAPMNGNVLEPLARKVLETGEAVRGIEIANAEGFWHLVSYYPVPATTGILGSATTVTDVTHLKTSNGVSRRRTSALRCLRRPTS